MAVKEIDIAQLAFRTGPQFVMAKTTVLGPGGSGTGHTNQFQIAGDLTFSDLPTMYMGGYVKQIKGLNTEFYIQVVSTSFSDDFGGGDVLLEYHITKPGFIPPQAVEFVTPANPYIYATWSFVDGPTDTRMAIIQNLIMSLGPPLPPVPDEASEGSKLIVAGNSTVVWDT